MTTHKPYVLIFVALFLFAVFTAGGCGGSSSSSSSQSQTSSEIPDMSSIFDTTEFEHVMNEIEAELREQEIDINDESSMPNIHFVMILSGDRAYIDNKFVGSSIKAHIKSAAAVTPQEIAAIGKELLPKYESGDIIALYFPTDSSINAMYQALNENINHFDGIANGSGDTYPEIYAIAKRYGLNATHYFSYVVPGSKTLLANTLLANLTSGDGKFDPEDGQDDSSDTTQNDYAHTLRQEHLFQARRYASFIRWVATLDKRVAALDAQAVSARAAFVQASDSDAGSGNFISMNSQNHDHDFSQIVTGYQPWGRPRYTFDINYASGTSWTIFAAHNFADGDDYYLVKQNAFSSPQHTWSGKNGGWDKCNFGQIVNFNVETQIPTASGSDVAVLTTAPRNVARKGSVTDGISTTIGGKFGVSAGGGPDGPTGGASAEISASLTYSHSETWETTEWTLTNNSGAISTKWDTDFDSAADYDTGDISDAGRHRVEFDSEWIWRVKKSYWSKNKNVPLKAWSTTWTGFTLWEYHWYKSNEHDAMSYGISGQHDFNMNRPSHVYVSEKSFTFGKGGGNSSFKMLCNSDYTITSSNADWCQISSEQRIGSDTGTTEREILFAVTSFDSSSSTLQTRTATITVTENSTGDTQTITVTQSNR